VRTYLYVTLIFNALAIVIGAKMISTRTYPRIESTAIGWDVARLLACCGLTAWAAYLLWG
jgi:hypothetical protein